MHLDVPIEMQRFPHLGKVNGEAASDIDNAMEQQQGYLRVPVWVIVLLVTIAGGLILNGAATVYWAATFRQSFQDFKDETYKQKTEHLDAEIRQLQLLLKAEQDQRKADIDLLTERQNDTRLRLAGKGILVK